VALGDRALQEVASDYLGNTYYAIGDFDRAAQLLRCQVDTPDRESGAPSRDVRIRSQVLLARTLGVMGAFT